MSPPTGAVCKPHENENKNEPAPWPTDERLGSYAGPAVDVGYHSSTCESCTAVLERIRGDGYGEKVPFANIQKSASGQDVDEERGCVSCTALTALLQPLIGPWAKDDAEIRIRLMELDQRFIECPIKLRLTAEGSEESRLVELFWPSEYVNATQVKGSDSRFLGYIVL